MIHVELAKQLANKLIEFTGLDKAAVPSTDKWVSYLAALGDSLGSIVGLQNWVLQGLENSGEVLTEAQLDDLKQGISKLYEQYDDIKSNVYSKLDTSNANPAGSKYWLLRSYNSAQQRRQDSENAANQTKQKQLTEQISQAEKTYEAEAAKRNKAEVGPLTYKYTK